MIWLAYLSLGFIVTVPGWVTICIFHNTHTTLISILSVYEDDISMPNYLGFTFILKLSVEDIKDYVVALYDVVCLEIQTNNIQNFNLLMLSINLMFN